jgi:hypothetical protein
MKVAASFLWVAGAYQFLETVRQKRRRLSARSSCCADFVGSGGCRPDERGAQELLRSSSRLCRLPCGKAMPFLEVIDSDQATPAIREAQPHEELNMAGRKGIAFPHGRRQSRCGIKTESAAFFIGAVVPLRGSAPNGAKTLCVSL